MRNGVVTVQLLKQARNAAIVQAEADERQARAMPRIQPAEPGRFARVGTLARRVRVLAARTT